MHKNRSNLSQLMAMLLTASIQYSFSVHVDTGQFLYRQNRRFGRGFDLLSVKIVGFDNKTIQNCQDYPLTEYLTMTLLE